jgi:dTDP-glucose pyrophosphorylase
MNKVQILMPMGGLGSRFAKEGYTTAKPLISVDEKPMFMKALDSFKTNPGFDFEYLFVIRKDQNEKYDLAHQIKQSIPSAKISILEKDTQGAVETCLLAEDYIDDTLPIIIADCDIYFESKEYFSKINTSIQDHSPDALLLTFQSSDTRYSYVKLGTDNQVVATAEKIVISDNAILGGYYFRSGKLFKDLAHEFADKPLPTNIKEYYLSHLFNLLIERSGKIEIAKIDQKHIFGTPEELNLYLSKS